MGPEAYPYQRNVTANWRATDPDMRRKESLFSSVSSIECMW